MAATYQPEVSPVPSPVDGSGMKYPPWGHQVRAINRLRELLTIRTDRRTKVRVSGGRALLWMWMGTGKTYVAINMAVNLKISNQAGDQLILVLAPQRVAQDVWPDEIQKHAQSPPAVRVLEERWTAPRKQQEAERALEAARERRERLIIICNYESIWRSPLAEWTLKQEWGLVILDECHRLKSANGKASRFAAHLRNHARYIIGMTGTFLPHSPLDAFAQARAIEEKVFGTNKHAFEMQYCVMGGYSGHQILAWKNREHFNNRIATIAFIADKNVLDLPPETNQTMYCDLSPEALRTYRRLENDFIAEVAEGSILTAANAMTALNRLAQLTGGWLPDDQKVQHEVDQSKKTLLREILEDLNEPVVVFARYRKDLDNIHWAASQLHIGSLEVSGRRDELRQWQTAPDGVSPILAVQIQAGGLGVDLTRARVAIYYSVGYSLGEFDQAKARIHRPGQTRPVFQVYLVARGTVDEKIIAALEKRKDIVEAILEEIKRGQR